MTTKEYLEIATGIDTRINSLSERIEILQCKAENITPTYSSTASSGNVSQSKMSDAVEEKVDYENQIQQIKDEFLLFKHRVEFEIQRIPNNIYATLLEEKYIKGKKWEDIAEIIGYSDIKYVREVIHNRALSEFEKITPENTRFVPCILRQK